MSKIKKDSGISYDARSNFGVKGWWIIIFSALCWFMFSNLGSAALNVIVPSFAGQLGLERGDLLSFTTPAGMAAIACSAITGMALKKWNVKRVNGVLLMLGTVSVVIWSFAENVIGYVFGLFLTFAMMNSVTLAGGNTAISNWFPKKKGIAIGWATMGLQFSGASIVPILTALTAKFGGIRQALWVLAGGLVVLAILNFVAFKDYPEEWDAYPDNNPNEKRREGAKLNTGWNVGSVLRRKETWVVSFGGGVYQMVTLGFVSTLVSSLIGKGFTPPQAVRMMLIANLLGAAGSYLGGFVDQKFGVKKACVIFGIWVVVGVAFYMLPGQAPAWVYVIMLGLAIGASNNYPLSLAAQIFGRDGAVVAFPVIFFIKGLFAYLVYVILGQSLSLTGAYNTGWIIVIVLIVISVILFAGSDVSPKDDPINL
jgi:OFA family oxalate/formate antiporter-like MFS transporter